MQIVAVLLFLFWPNRACPKHLRLTKNVNRTDLGSCQDCKQECTLYTVQYSEYSEVIVDKSKIKLLVALSLSKKGQCHEICLDLFCMKPTPSGSLVDRPK